jgi:hypothetical protein
MDYPDEKDNTPPPPPVSQDRPAVEVEKQIALLEGEVDTLNFKNQNLEVSFSI